MSTRAELITQVKANLGDRTDKDTVIGYGLDEAIKEISQLDIFQELVTDASVNTVAATATITITSGYHKLLSIVQTGDLSSHVVDLKTKQWIDERYPDPAQISGGRPLYAYEDTASGKLVIVPTPDAVYALQLTTYTLGTVATGGSTVNNVDGPLVAYATGYTFNSMERFNSGESWMSRYRNLLVSAIDDARNQPGIVSKATPTPLRVQGVVDPTDAWPTPESLPT